MYDFKPILRNFNKKDRPIAPPNASTIKKEDSELIELLKSIDKKLGTIIDKMPYKNSGLLGPG
jgi:hypothetical protein